VSRGSRRRRSALRRCERADPRTNGIKAFATEGIFSFLGQNICEILKKGIDSITPLLIINIMATKIHIDVEGMTIEALHFLVLVRDKHTCQIHKLTNRPKCLRNTSEIHHILAVSDGGKDEPDNLICLCEEHHSMIHVMHRDENGNGKGVKAKAIIFENGITQIELAGALGLTQSAVCQILQTASPSILCAVEIQKYIDKKTVKLFTIYDLFSRYCFQKLHYKQNAG